jgi:putative FmdB family regulatory protein
MPIYEYVCEECGCHFDALRSIRDADAPIQCQKCTSEHTTRQLSVFFARSGGRAVAGCNGGGCSGCAGGSCASCGGH